MDCTAPTVTKENCGLWGTMVHPCGFVSCNNAPPGGDVIMEQAVHVGSGGACGKALYPPLDYVVNLKLL